MPKARNSLYYYVYDRLSSKLGISLSNKLDKLHLKYYSGDVIFEVWDQTTAVVDGENSDGIEALLFRVEDFIYEWIEEEW